MYNSGRKLMYDLTGLCSSFLVLLGLEPSVSITVMFLGVPVPWTSYPGIHCGVAGPTGLRVTWW